MENVTLVDGKKRRTRVEVFVMTDDDRVLVATLKPDNLPMLPGGGVDKNEPFIVAAVRETAEEAGWRVSNPRLIEFSGAPNLYVVDEPGWLASIGVEEELQIAVVCDAIGFEPDDRYCSEGDGMHFEPWTIAKLKAETMKVINEGIGSHWTYVYTFRLAALSVIENNIRLRKAVAATGKRFNEPGWVGW